MTLRDGGGAPHRAATRPHRGADSGPGRAHCPPRGPPQRHRAACRRAARKCRSSCPRVFLKAGSVFDPADKSGLANLTSSLVLGARPSAAAFNSDDAIEFVGGSLEAGRRTATASPSRSRCSARSRPGPRSAGRGPALAHVSGGGAHPKGRADPGGHQALGRRSEHGRDPRAGLAGPTRTTRTASRSRDHRVGQQA